MIGLNAIRVYVFNNARRIDTWLTAFAIVTFGVALILQMGVPVQVRAALAAAIGALWALILLGVVPPCALLTGARNAYLLVGDRVEICGAMPPAFGGLRAGTVGAIHHARKDRAIASLRLSVFDACADEDWIASVAISGQVVKVPISRIKLLAKAPEH
jgi:hypothetical protein